MRVRGGWRAVQGRGGADGRARLPVRNECDAGRRGEAAEIVDEARLVAPVLCVDVQKQLWLAVSRGHPKLEQVARRIPRLLQFHDARVVPQPSTARNRAPREERARCAPGLATQAAPRPARRRALAGSVRAAGGAPLPRGTPRGAPPDATVAAAGPGSRRRRGVEKVNRRAYASRARRDEGGGEARGKCATCTAGSGVQRDVRSRSSVPSDGCPPADSQRRKGAYPTPSGHSLGRCPHWAVEPSGPRPRGGEGSRPASSWSSKGSHAHPPPRGSRTHAHAG